LNDDIVAYSVEGFFNVKAHQLKGPFQLLGILYQVCCQHGGFLDAFACYEATLVFADDFGKGQGQSFGKDS
jgi:hypothetical protein